MLAHPSGTSLTTTHLALAVLGAFAAGCAPTAQVSKPLAAGAEDALGRDAITRMAGCYIVDYNYHETKSLQAQYERDQRVYDPNDEGTALEWILALEEGPKHIRLQHVLFLLDGHGKLVEDSMIRHQAEDWEYEPAWVWEYEGQYRWKKVDTRDRKGQWVRRITALDDGLRYQCIAPWRDAGPRAEWLCGDNFSPIPGRETRDMKRKDYQGLLRETRLVVFPGSWVEKQKNVKVVTRGAAREPLAEEVGRNWYVRVEDSRCEEAARWTKERLPFWELLQETWAPYFAGHDEWRETPPGSGRPRWMKMAELEQKQFAAVAAGADARAAAQKEMRAIIEADRAGAPQ